MKNFLAYHPHLPPYVHRPDGQPGGFHPHTALSYTEGCRQNMPGGQWRGCASGLLIPEQIYRTPNRLWFLYRDARRDGGRRSWRQLTPAEARDWLTAAADGDQSGNGTELIKARDGYFPDGQAPDPATRVSLQLPPEAVAAVEARAQAAGIPRTLMLRHLVEAGLDRTSDDR